MRMTFVLLTGVLLLAGCDNNETTSETDTSTHTGDTAQPDTTPAPDRLVRILHNLERTDAQCDGDRCPVVSIEWITFEGQPALNQAIETPAGRCAGPAGRQRLPTTATIEGLAEAFLSATRRTWPWGSQWMEPVPPG